MQFVKKMGRPRKVITRSTFEGLCKIQCTRDEAASVLNVSHDTLERWCKETYSETFASVLKRFASHGKSSLRRAQFKAAQNGNATMLVWLGKQYLDQTDKMSIDVKQLDSDIERELALITAGSQADITGEVESETVN